MGQDSTDERSEARHIGSGPLMFASVTCGACVMVLEMAGARVVAPFVGTSQIVWTSLIGVIMASLSVGYWAGGRIADRRPDARVLAYIIAGAAAASAAAGAGAQSLLGALSDVTKSIYASSLIGSLVLFTVPNILLGMVSPYIVKLAMSGVVSAGATVGRYYALSSIGSIIGTFLGGFVLISFMSSRTVIFSTSAVLALVALVLHGGAARVMVPLIAAAVGLGIYSEAGASKLTKDGIDIETRYNVIHIQDTNVWLTKREVRMLQTDPMGAQSLLYLDAPSELYSDYTKFYDLAFHYKPDTKRVLMLGGGGYCVPRHITATRPEVDVDVVELDPGITQAARDWFFLTDRPGQRIFHEDARMYINRESAAGTKYDAVFEDVFGSSYSIPFHLTTVECMGGIYEMINDGGALVINVISEVGGELFAGIYASVAAHFPTVMIFPATYPNSAAVRQNVMIVALKRDDVPEREPATPQIASLLRHRWTAPYEPKIAAFTDAFAPVEKHSLVR